CLHFHLHLLFTCTLSSLFFLTLPRPPTSTLFPYTTLFRSLVERSAELGKVLLSGLRAIDSPLVREVRGLGLFSGPRAPRGCRLRSEEHTSELQSPYDLVCRLLLEKKKNKQKQIIKSLKTKE